MFCTNGVLLRMLTGAGRTPLDHVTHLVRAGGLGAWGLGVGAVLDMVVERLCECMLWVPMAEQGSGHRTIPLVRATPPPSSAGQVVDEIHERDRFADFLLILVRPCRCTFCCCGA